MTLLYMIDGRLCVFDSVHDHEIHLVEVHPTILPVSGRLNYSITCTMHAIPTEVVTKQLHKLGIIPTDMDTQKRLDLLTERIDNLSRYLQKTENASKREEMFNRLERAMESLEGMDDPLLEPVVQHLKWQLTAVMQTAEELVETIKGGR